MPSRTRTTGPSESLIELMNAYGKYFETEFKSHFASLPEELNETRDAVLSVPMKYSDLIKYEPIARSFENVLNSIEVANTVLNDRSRALNPVEYRLRPRLVDLPDSRQRTLESLRMRDRGKFFSFECMISDVQIVMGYIKTAAYHCKDCGVDLKVPQKIARERKKPRFCKSCFDIAIEKDGTPPPLPPGWLELDVEECEYEDIQYLKLTNWVPRPEKPAPDPITHINAVIDDELVSTLKEGQFVRVNAIVEIDHLPGRDYVKDTRRVLVLRILSVEEIQGLEYSTREEMAEKFRMLEPADEDDY